MELIEATAPGRCGIVGNPSDIYGGKVLSCSLPNRARCRMIRSRVEKLPEDTRLWDAALKRHPIRGVYTVTWSTDVPRSSGLAGSTALLATTLACVLAARYEAPDFNDPRVRVAFAELVRDVERHDAEVMCGYQDAYMVVHGGLQLMDFAGKHPVIAGPPAMLEAQPSLPPRFLVITTGVERLSGSVHGPMSERWLRGEQEVIDAMRRFSELAPLGASAIRTGEFTKLAELMTENQELIASLGGSGEAVDTLIEKCKAHGALTAKLAGAGMGGTVIALVEDPADLERRLRDEGYSIFTRPEASAGVRFEAILDGSRRT